MSKSDPLICVEALCAGYDAGHPVLSGVGFEVCRGERVAVIGPNGSGKTTLIKCLGGLLRPFSGDVFLHGRRVTDYRVGDLARLVAYVPQPMGAGLPFRVRDFVMMGRYPHRSILAGVTSRDIEAVHTAMALTGTEKFAERIHGTLSGGERQKVMIAAALAQETDVLLLDEPSAFLDPGHQHEIDGILLAVNRDRNATIISVTHDVNRAALMNTRIIALKDGRIVCDSPAREALTPAILLELYETTAFTQVPHPTTGVMMTLPEALS